MNPWLSEIFSSLQLSWGQLSLRTRLWQLSILGLIILSNGLSTIPLRILDELLQFSINPFGSNLFERHYGETPFFFLFNNAIGIANRQQYVSLCLLLLAAIYLVPFAQEKTQRTAPVMLFIYSFAAHPVAYTLQTWIGMADVITVLATMIAFCSKSIIWIGATSLILTTNHTAAPLILLPLLSLRILSRRNEIGLKHIIASIIGIAIGYIILQTFFGVMEIEPSTRFAYIREISLQYWIRINTIHFPIVVYSFLFSLWIPVVVMLLLFNSTNRLFYATYLCVLLCYFCITFFTKDTTRVFSLLSWAITLYGLSYTWDISVRFTQKREMFRASVCFAVIFAWAFPKVSVWNGNLYAPWIKQPLVLIWEIIQH